MEFKLREIRKSKNMTQKELSEISGVGRITISRLESGALTETSAKTLLKLSAALDCNMQDLIHYSNASGL